MLTRRQFASSLVGAYASRLLAQAKKKIAFITTDLDRASHGQFFLDRYALGYGMGGRWIEPKTDVASVWVDQYGENDVGKERMRQYGLREFPTIAEALTLGGSTLAVDGVVVIGEHGNYPKNAKGQKLYPRYEWFKEVMNVFEDSGRSVPVFNDKHLSITWARCREMVDDSRRLGFPFYAGSSLPVTWRLPAIDVPFDTPMSESVCVAYGQVDSYDIHALETAQCMSERRRGGEAGIRSVHAATGEKVWELLAARETTRELFVSALSRSHSAPVDLAHPREPITFDWARRALTEITGYFIEHLDGFHTAMFLTDIRDFNYAGMRSDNGEIIGCQMLLPLPGRNATTADFFNPLVSHVEQMIVTGETPYPIERTLLTSGMVIGGVESLFAGQVPYETKDMAIAYRGPEESMYWRV